MLEIAQAVLELPARSRTGARRAPDGRIVAYREPMRSAPPAEPTALAPPLVADEFVIDDNREYGLNRGRAIPEDLQWLQPADAAHKEKELRSMTQRSHRRRPVRGYPRIAIKTFQRGNEYQAGPDIIDMVLGEKGRWRLEKEMYGGPRALRRLNLRGLNASEKRLRRYHPYFVTKRRRLLDRDKQLFPNEVGRVEPHFRQNWLENYYEGNPTVWRRAVGNPKRMTPYLRRHLANLKPMTKWLKSRIHTVKPGENLSKIARKHTLSLASVKAKNRWLLKRPGGKRRKGFDFVRPGDRIILPPRWNVPRGRRDPFPRDITRIRGGDNKQLLRNRQQWLRAYYHANPLAAMRARQDVRKIKDYANRYLRK